MQVRKTEDVKRMATGNGKTIMKTGIETRGIIIMIMGTVMITTGITTEDLTQGFPMIVTATMIADLL
jgi:hypothetical protein